MKNRIQSCWRYHGYFPISYLGANVECVFSWTQTEWPNERDVLNVGPLDGLSSLEYSFKAISCRDLHTFLKSNAQFRATQNPNFREQRDGLAVIRVKWDPPYRVYILICTCTYVYWTVHHLDSWIKRDQLDVTCFIISLFNAQHVSDVNTFILRRLRLICWVISWVVLLWFDVCWCYVVVWLGWCGIRMRTRCHLLYYFII